MATNPHGGVEIIGEILPQVIHGIAEAMRRRHVDDAQEIHDTNAEDTQEEGNQENERS